MALFYLIGKELEQEIIGLFRDTTSVYSINQIAKKLDKAYPYINKKVNQLIKLGILHKIQVGRSYLCSINLENDYAINLLSLDDIKRKQKLKFNRDTFSSITDSFPVHTIFHYKGKYHFILDYLNDRDAILNRYKIADAVFLDISGFHDLLLQDRSILQGKIVIYHHEKYYELVQKIGERLRGKYSLQNQ